MHNSTALTDAYLYCSQLTRSHYENFPVASHLLPAPMREAISVIYAFARTADDIADEGSADANTRTEQLNEYLHELDKISANKPIDSPLFVALADVIKNHQLSISLFADLITAFKQDVVKRRYQSLDEVLQYCQLSANPVGRIVLELNKQNTPENIADSDKICSALQLINFYQDIEQDYLENNRIYLPVEALQSEQLSNKDFYAFFKSSDGQAQLRGLYEFTHSLMTQGSALATRLTGRLGLEIRMTVWGGLKILDKLQQQQNLLSRPRLKWHDWMVISMKAIARTQPSTV